MKTKSFTLVAAVLFVVATLAPAATNDLSSALQKGLFEEEANHNLDAAIAAYQSVATQFDKDRKLAATAIFRLGEVYRKQGKTNEANAQYERIVRDFADQTTLVDLSKIHVQKTERVGTLKVSAPPSQLSLEDTEIRRIKTMIKDSPDLINANGPNGVPLHYAAKNGLLRVAEFLLANGADVNRPDSSGIGTTAIHRAVESGYKEMVQLIISHGADLEAKDGTGGTSLHIASRNGFKAIAEILLKNKANANAKNNVSNRSETPLHLATTAGHRAVVEVLVSNGADVNARNNPDQTPLHLAVVAKNLEMVKFFIAHKADINAVAQQDWTALHFAVEIAQPQLVEFLLQKGANVESKLQVYTIRNVGISSTGSSYPVYSFSPLHIAAQLGKTEIAELLLATNANPNSTNSNGATPLHFAASVGAVEIADALLKKGALINSIERDGATPLQWAIFNQQKGTTELLLANKADSNVQNKSGETPLWKAKKLSSPAREEFVALLLKYGANENFERMARISVKRDGKEQTVFPKGNQPLNRYSLLELIVLMRYSFPDLANVKIDRLDEGVKKSRIIPVNVEEMLKSGDCAKNVWLEWGDVVEIPESDHRLNESWPGYPKEYAETMQKCLERKFAIVVKGGTTNLILGVTIQPGGMINSSQVTLWSYNLGSVVGSHLRASSDRSRIKVKRTDPVTKQSHEIIVNLEKQQTPDLWLLDGDQIEIPERDPNVPPAALDNPQGIRTIPTRTLQLPPSQPLSPIPPN